MDHSVAELLGDASLLDGSIITSVSVPTSGVATAARTARTPMDQPIVMAVAYRGSGDDVRLAIAGVGPIPTIVEPDGLDDLDPPADFRGSSEYRSQVASVLAGRVLDEVGGGE
jgi:CO/xanthine dehydrogenase FAD-binding subunit